MQVFLLKRNGWFIMTLRIVGILLVIIGGIGVFFSKQLIAFFKKDEPNDTEIVTFKLCALLITLAGAGSVFLS